ncbi:MULTISPECIES: class I SAM-dependent methyltransferase [unclassified Roseovarius]|uniref:class I SAM-dependent methyltransferase n=1 Tax=unclassified Roseovarius TaxID=2614913 RepID=UPI0027400415|nr:MULTISPECIES: class I SAM-dependent methyltransferase [unclassified Roseovarius]
MNPRVQLRIQRYGWDAAAPFYHDGWEAQLRGAHAHLMRLADIQAGQHVLEIACGSGLVTTQIAQAVGEDGDVLATDISQGMLDDLEQRLLPNLRRRVTFRRMPAEALSVSNGTFDAAVSALGLMYTTDPGTALRNMARAVKKGGTVAATVWGERNNCGWAEVFPIVDARVSSEVCPLFFRTGAPGALVRQFHDAEIENITEHRHSEILNFASDDQLVDAVLLGGPVAMAVKRFNETDWHDVRQEFLESVSAFKHFDGSYHIPGEFLTVKGIRQVLQ